MQREGEAESHCHEQELRGRAPQNQENSRAVDLGRNLEPSLDEAAGLGAHTIVLIEQQSASPPFKKL